MTTERVTQKRPSRTIVRKSHVAHSTNSAALKNFNHGSDCGFIVSRFHNSLILLLLYPPVILRTISRTFMLLILKRFLSHLWMFRPQKLTRFYFWLQDFLDSLRAINLAFASVQQRRRTVFRAKWLSQARRLRGFFRFWDTLVWRSLPTRIMLILSAAHCCPSSR